MADETQTPPILDLNVLQALSDRGFIDKDVYNYAQKNAQSDEQKNAIAQNVAEAAQKDPQVKEVLSKAHDLSGLTEEKAQALKQYMIQSESSGNPDAVSNKGATGLMQLMPKTAEEEAGKLGMKDYDLKNPQDNEKLGTGYMVDLLNKYHGDHELALAAYNAGLGNVDRAIHISVENGGTSSWNDVKKVLPLITGDHAQKETIPYVDKITKEFEGGLPHSPTMMARNTATPPATQSDPTFMDKLNNLLVPNAMAEEPPAAAPNPIPSPVPTDTATPQSTPTEAMQVPIQMPPPGPQTDKVLSSMLPDNGGEAGVGPSPQSALPPPPSSDAELAGAAQAANAGDTVGTLDSLANGENALSDEIKLKNASLMESQGKMASSQAEAAGKAEESQVFEKQAQDLTANALTYSKQRQVVQDQIQKNTDLLQKQITDFNSASIDPDRVFTGGSTFGKILMGIGLALNAVGNTPQQAMQNVQNIINTDISAQKAQLELKKEKVGMSQNLLETNYKLYHNLESAEEATRAQINSFVDAHIKQIATKTTSDQAQANLQTLSGQMQQDQVTALQKFKLAQQKIHSENALLSQQLQGKTPEQQQLEIQALNDPKGMGTRIVRDLNNNPVGYTQTSKQTIQFNNALNSHDLITNSLNDLREIRQSVGGSGVPFSPDTAKNVDIIVQKLKMGLEKQAIGEGASKAAAFMSKRINEMMPDSFMQSNYGILGRTIYKGAYHLGGENPDVTLNELQKEANVQFFSEANQLLQFKTEGFKASLLGLMSEIGKEPDVKPLNKGS